MTRKEWIAVIVFIVFNLVFIAVLTIPRDGIVTIELELPHIESREYEEMSLINQYDNLIRDAVGTYFPPKYDWRLYKAQLIQESMLNPLARSEAGAVGLSQMMRGTWTQWAKKADYAGHKRTEPEASVNVGALYMAYLIKQWSRPRPTADRYCLAMASYNAGLGNILKAQKLMGDPGLYADIIVGLPAVTGKKNSNETITYVSRILDFCSDQIIGDIK